MTLYGPADAFFLCLHSLVIVFNLCGWIWRKTRRANLLLLTATGASWVILGTFYGLGYCPLTDWHYQVLWQAGVHDLPRSYIAYMCERLSGWRPPPLATDVVTAFTFACALAVSLVVNWRDWRKARHKTKA